MSEQELDTVDKIVSIAIDEADKITSKERLDRNLDNKLTAADYNGDKPSSVAIPTILKYSSPGGSNEDYHIGLIGDPPGGRKTVIKQQSGCCGGFFARAKLKLLECLSSGICSGRKPTKTTRKSRVGSKDIRRKSMAAQKRDRRPSRKSISEPPKPRGSMLSIMGAPDSSNNNTRRASKISLRQATETSDPATQQKKFRKQTKLNTARNLRRNSVVGDKLNIELKLAQSTSFRRDSRVEISPDIVELLSKIHNPHSLSTHDLQGPRLSRQSLRGSIASDRPLMRRGSTAAALQHAATAAAEQYAALSKIESNASNNGQATSEIRRSDETMLSPITKEPLKTSQMSLTPDFQAESSWAKAKKIKTVRRASIAFGDETVTHYDLKGGVTAGSFLHTRSRSILHIPEEEETPIRACSNGSSEGRYGPC